MLAFFPNAVRKGPIVSNTESIGEVKGGPRVLLRIEGLVLFAASIALFSFQGQQWWLYPLLLLVPDIFMLGYLKNTKLGSIAYNFGHSYPVAALVVTLGFIFVSPITISIGAIWFGHIGWDRMLGYGLKYETSFQHTHLGHIGKGSKAK
jgi:hypothetical protein